MRSPIFCRMGTGTWNCKLSQDSMRGISVSMDMEILPKDRSSLLPVNNCTIPSVSTRFFGIDKCICDSAFLMLYTSDASVTSPAALNKTGSSSFDMGPKKEGYNLLAAFTKMPAVTERPSSSFNSSFTTIPFEFANGIQAVLNFNVPNKGLMDPLNSKLGFSERKYTSPLNSWCEVNFKGVFSM